MSTSNMPPGVSGDGATGNVEPLNVMQRIMAESVATYRFHADRLAQGSAFLDSSPAMAPVHSRSRLPKGPGSGMNAAEPAKVVSLGMLDEPPPRLWFVAGIIPQGATTIVAGHSGLGKSYVALYLAIHVCIGRAFLGRAVKQAPVLWVDREIDQDENARRAFAVARGMGLERPPENLFYVRPLDAVGTDAAQALILTAIEEHGIGLTVLDSLTLGSIGDASEQRDVVPVMRCVEAWGTSVCIDHITKGGAAGNQSSATIFGSAMKRAIARSTFALVPAGCALSLRPDKSNFGPASTPLHFVKEHVDDEHGRPEVVFRTVEAGDEELAGAEEHAPAHEQTLFALIRLYRDTDRPVPLSMLAADRGIKESTVRNHVSMLKEQVVRHRDNTYTPVLADEVPEHSRPDSRSGTAGSEVGNGDPEADAWADSSGQDPF